MKNCKWCGVDYDDISAHEYAKQNNLQYRWDALNYCGEECCKKDWDKNDKKYTADSIKLKICGVEIKGFAEPSFIIEREK